MKTNRHFLLWVVAFLLMPFFANAQQSKQIMLAGYKLKPVVGTSGSGVLTVTIKDDTLRVHGDFANLMSTYTGAYIMAGTPGDNGNSLYTLEVKTNDDETGGTLEATDNTFVLNDAQISLLKKGNLYVVVSSSDHQNGEIAASIPPMGS